MSLSTAIWIAAGVYVAIAVLAFIASGAGSGPATPGLCLLRAVLWPLWLAGMIPGERLPMD